MYAIRSYYALRKDKDERYQTMKSLLADLKTLKAEMEFAEKLERTGSPEARDERDTRESANEATEAGKPRTTVATKSGPKDLFSKRNVAIAGLIGLVIAVSAIGYYFYSNTAAAPLTDKDVILITDFENKTGDEDFDGALRQGLTMALEQSPFRITSYNVCYTKLLRKAEKVHFVIPDLSLIGFEQTAGLDDAAARADPTDGDPLNEIVDLVPEAREADGEAA